MKKFGFTLSELLITVGIIGVVAALTAPAVSNIMPDRNKMMFMKNYKELTSLTEKMLNDPELYYTTYILDDDGKKVPTCVGLACTDRPRKINYDKDDYKGAEKYSNLCRDFLGGTPIKGGAWFRTSDNTIWRISNLGIAGSEPKTIAIDDPIYFIVNTTSINDTDTACSYGSSCKKPTKFTFDLDSYGNITPDKEDYLSQAYLLNPNNMNNKKKDFACAAAIKADTTGKAPADICAELDD